MTFQVDLACPYCTGRFQAPVSAEIRSATCPHCDRTVTVPAAPLPPVPPVLPSPKVPNPPQKTAAEAGSPYDVVEPAKILVNRRGEAVSLRRRSPEERDRYRRRLNFAYALAGLVVLSIALAVLLWFRP